MILSEDGKVRIMGTGLNVLRDFAVASASVTKSLLDAGVSYEDAKSIMKKTLYVGMIEACKKKNETIPEMEEMNKAVNEFFDKFRFQKMYKVYGIIYKEDEENEQQEQGREWKTRACAETEGIRL